MKYSFCSLATVVAMVLVASSARAGFITDPSSGFSNQYNGNEIWGGGALVNEWTVDGGMTTGSLSLAGTTLVVDSDANNGWVQHDSGGTTPWELGSGDYAFETQIQLRDLNLDLPSVMTLWAESEGERNVIVITDTTVELFDGNVLASGIDNVSAPHVYRTNYDASTGDIQVLRDGVLLYTGALAFPGLGVDERLIVGDCCTTINGIAANPVDRYEIGYVRYQFASTTSVPEPTSFALTALGLIGIVAGRRRRSRIS